MQEVWGSPVTLGWEALWKDQEWYPKLPSALKLPRSRDGKDLIPLSEYFAGWEPGSSELCFSTDPFIYSTSLLLDTPSQQTGHEVSGCSQLKGHPWPTVLWTLASQSGTHRPEASPLPGSSLEMPNLRPSLQIYWMGICILSEIPDDAHAHEGFGCTSLTNTQSGVLDSRPPRCHCLYHGHKLPARVPSPSFSLRHPHNAQMQNTACTTDPPFREHLLDTCRALSML